MVLELNESALKGQFSSGLGAELHREKAKIYSNTNTRLVCV